MAGRTTETADTLEEGIELRSTGTINLYVESKKYRLRRPRVREFRRFREQMQDTLEDLDERADAVLSKQQEQQDEIDRRVADGGEPMTDAEKRERRKWGRELTAMREDAMLDWWHDVCSSLLDGGTWLDVEEQPAWMVRHESAVEIVQHWQSCPSLSGVR